MATRDRIIVFINGRRHEVTGEAAFISLSDFLRQRLALVGTKIVCSEGDCGSCTVLLGRLQGDDICYRPIDSCIAFMFQLDGVHIVTIEGLSRDGNLSPVQQAMVDCHGSQCGFCTPGFVMAMSGVCHEAASSGETLTQESWRHALTGNLCRCTGYTPILAAAERACADTFSIDELYSTNTLVAELFEINRDALVIESSGGDPRKVFCPASLAEALALRKEHPAAKIVAGATDVGVQLNKRIIAPEVFLDLNRVAELTAVNEQTLPDGRKAIVAGARANWTELLEWFQSRRPEFAEILSVFGSPQIRHMGTIGGNIINASPIADSLPFLVVIDAELELASVTGRRRVNINQFYRGYKQFDLRPGELLVSVSIPLPAEDDLLRLYKVSRRHDLDISTFTAAIRLRVENETIAAAAVAYGAVSPTVRRLWKTEEFLRGKPFNEETMLNAGEVAVAEITPITDVRGTADYRLQLARNVLLKFYWQQQAGEAIHA